jgi:hypothetical protein
MVSTILCQREETISRNLVVDISVEVGMKEKRVTWAVLHDNSWWTIFPVPVQNLVFISI